MYDSCPESAGEPDPGAAADDGGLDEAWLESARAVQAGVGQLASLVDVDVAEVQQILAADAVEGRPQYVCPEQVAWSEITAALRWSPVTGESRILEAEALTSTWRPLLDAMLAGTVTIEHMRAIGRQLRHLPGRASGAARPPSATTGCF